VSELGLDVLAFRHGGFDLPRDIPVGNGDFLVNFDQHYQLRDFYFPHVGQENHAGAGPCRFGVFGSLPKAHENGGDRRRRRLYWTYQGWDIKLGYKPDTLATDARLRHDDLQIELRCSDVVDFHRLLMVRRIEVVNLSDQPREVRLFHHNDFNMYGTRVGDTAYYDPKLRAMIHYRTNRYIMACWFADGEQQIDEYATGTAGFHGAEGTWRDAEDGSLGCNAIAQGAVDSTIMLNVALEPGGSKIVYLLLGAGKKIADLEHLHSFIHSEGPAGVIDRTTAYWKLWLAACRVEFPSPDDGGPSNAAVDLFKRSLLVVRTQIDNSGAIVAANDSDIMQFSRDTYSYLWPRDGALVAAGLDAAGFPDVARSFYSLCAKIITEQGYFLHKYNPDGSPASSWHPWVSQGKPQLPIQEDETALVIWALWRHYQRYRDIEFVRSLWVQLVTPAADFMARYRDPATLLPLPSYDLWEERWGVHAFTVASVYAGLQAAWKFATCFGDQKRAEIYARAAEQVRAAFVEHFWSPEQNRYLRRLVPTDHNRTSFLIGEVLAGRSPIASTRPPIDRFSVHEASTLPPEPGLPPSTSDPLASAVEFERDEVLDSSLAAIVNLGMLDPHDERVEKTLLAIESKLWVRGGIGGVARYENDYYQRCAEHSAAIPGNPWFICTLWLAEWRIARARDVKELQLALPYLDWTAANALPSGVLPEQVHPLTGGPISVSPLTWSHAAVVSAMVAYVEKYRQMSACPSCGQHRTASEEASDALQSSARAVA
jgi:GH15 family glucan-1,4-alpha-glucosidase